MTTLETPPPTVLISNLLACAIHALSTGGDAESIALTFARFYSEIEIQDSREKLNLVGCNLGKRSYRKDTKEKNIDEIVKALIILDWKDKDITIAADDLTRICHVPMNIDDEILLRTEMACMKERFLDLENLCKKMICDIQEINEKVLTSTVEFRTTTTAVLEKLKPTENAQPVINTTEEKAQNTFTNKWSDAVRKKPTLKIPLRRTPVADMAQTPSDFIPLSPSDRRLHPTYQTPTTERTDNITGDWKTITRRKRKPMILGKGQNSAVKGVKLVKIVSLFLTRCPPETPAADIKKYLEDENSWIISEVVKLNTRRDSYASFRVDVQLTNETVDLMSPECWPTDTYVRKFHREPRLGSAHWPAKPPTHHD